ncbi:hypothetical protein [Geomesophilobacter sediminis]|uniref:Uncharacterized protein n=1 Tax=Geomesophilobacter sediminis TaxID=2798584 RepID=A0A8J7JMA0_9BACT|nr:hypothetical protein [Geomesophilobacter sediminis]MBJ6725645.1 hypothetical protein [Geomesophilobacter sediminis]
MLGFGTEVFKSWSDEQRRDEIGKLVQGYRNGFPIQLLCQMATDIAGSESSAKQHLCALLTRKERKDIIKKEAGTNDDLRGLLTTFLL